MTLRKRLALALPLMCATGLGCSHRDESPKVSLSSIEPDLVCNAQLTTPVLIHGKGFTPLTTRALKNKPLLVLPEVWLTQTQTLLGEPEKAKPVVVSGTPKHSNASSLSWQNEGQLTVNVTEGLELAPGLYDLTVTNPDGERKAELAQALAVVPPPVLTKLEPASLCNAQSDQTLVLVGTTFLDVGGELPTVTITAKDGDTVEQFTVTAVDDCEEIPGRADTVQTCTHATIVIPAETLEAGDYTVVLTNPQPAACASTEAVTLTVNPPPEVLSVAPSTVCSGGSDLQIVGNHFQDGASVELRCEGEEPIVATEVAFQDSQHLEVTFGAGMAPGATCDVVVLNPDTCTDEPLPHQTVTGTEGPIAFYADPSVSYTGITTRVTVYLTAVSGSFDVALIAEDGTETALGDAALVSGKTNRIQATVPAGLPAGSYDIAVRDETQCRALLTDGVVLTDQTSIALSAIDPPFAKSGISTAVTITRTGTGTGFAPTPRLFLMTDAPQTGDVAVQLNSVTVVNATTLTAVVPASTAAGVYDLVVVDATGSEVGLLDKAMTVTVNAPPVINNVVPQSIVAASGQLVEVLGQGFSGSTVSLRCVDAAGLTTTPPPVTVATETCAANACTQTATVDGSAIAAGSICVVRVTNTDNSYGEFSAIGVTNSSFNLNTPHVGQPLQQGRRALTAAAVKATRASRYVYAIGGDTGDNTIARGDVEVAAVDIFGNMQPWTTARTALGTARSQAGSTVLGRYIYVFGGTTDGSTALATGERTLVLSPEEVPEITDVDLCLAGGTANCFGVTGQGIGEGAVSYRVSAVIAATDTQNLGGETLASENLVLRLPTIASRNVVVKLAWTAPVDATGNVLTGIVGYRIYRTPLGGIPGRDEVIIGVVNDPTVREYIDDGSVALGTEVPLASGSTSAWQALPNLTVARAGHSAAIAPEPGSTTLWHLYALLGKDTATATGGNVLSTYEHLTITSLTNGRQTVATAWTAGNNTVSAARFHAGAWTVDHDAASLVTSGNTWIYLGGGALANGNGVGNVDATLVGTAGVLGPFDTIPADFSSSRIGYGTAAAAGRLFAFGGRAPNPKANAIAAPIIAPVPTLAANAWNNEGLNLSSERYLPGTAIQSAFIFLIGGESTTNAAQTSTDLVVW